MDSKRQSWLILLTTACTLVSGPALVHGQPDKRQPDKAGDDKAGGAEAGGAKAGDDKARKARAAKLYKQGRQAAARGDKLAGKGKREQARASYGAAAGHFLEAYRTIDNPLLLYVLGQVYQSRAELEWARKCYEHYLERDPDGQKADDVKARIADVAAALAKGEKSAKDSDVAPDMALDPVDVCYQAVPDKLEPEPEPEPLPVPEPRDRTTGGQTAYRVSFWASAGVTAGSATVALLTLLQISDFEAAKNDAVTVYQSNPGNLALDANDVCTDAAGRLDRGEVNASLQTVVDSCESGKSRALISNIMQGVSVAALLATGFFLYKGYLQKTGKEKNTAATLITPTITRRGVGAQLLWRF